MQHSGHRHVAGIFQASRDLAWRVDTAHVFSDEVTLLGFVFEQGVHGQPAILHVPRQLDRVKNLLIAGAAADIAAKPLLDFLTINEWVRAQRGGRRHHHPGNAITALAGPRLMESLLQDAEFAGLCQCLDGLDRRVLGLGHGQQTGLHQHAVEEHRARAAFAGAAALLVACQIEIVADEVEQALMRPGHTRNFAAIDRGLELKVRHRPPPVQMRGPHESAPARRAALIRPRNMKPRTTSRR